MCSALCRKHAAVCVLSSLVVLALIVWYCLPEGMKQNSLWAEVEGVSGDGLDSTVTVNGGYH